MRNTLVTATTIRFQVQSLEIWCDRCSTANKLIFLIGFVSEGGECVFAFILSMRMNKLLIMRHPLWPKPHRQLCRVVCINGGCHQLFLLIEGIRFTTLWNRRRRNKKRNKANIIFSFTIFRRFPCPAIQCGCYFYRFQFLLDTHTFTHSLSSRRLVASGYFSCLSFDFGFLMVLFFLVFCCSSCSCFRRIRSNSTMFYHVVVLWPVIILSVTDLWATVSFQAIYVCYFVHPFDMYSLYCYQPNS